MKKNRVKKAVVSLTILSLIMLGGCGKTTEKGKETDNKKPQTEEEAWKKEPAYSRNIKVGYNGGACVSALGLADVEGFYKEQGLENIEIVKMGGTEAESLGTGSIDVAAAHITGMLIPAINGSNVVFMSGMHTGCKSLYVLSDSAIKKTADLEGNSIAINDGIGNSDHNISLRFLKKDDVDIDKVKFKVVDTSAVIAAMDNGEIQAATLSDQFALKFVKEGKLKAIRSITTDDEFKDETCCGYAMNRKFVEENPITAKKLVKANRATNQWIEENKEEAVDKLLDNDWVSGEKEDIVKYMTTLNFDVSDESTEKTMENIISDYKELGLIEKDKKAKDILEHVWKIN